MFIFQNSRLRQPFAVPASLSRCRALCRLDLRQKRWALPAQVIRRDRHLNFTIPAEAATLALGVSQTILNFSDPSLGGANPSNSARGQIAILAVLPRSLGEKQTTKKGKMKPTHLTLAAGLAIVLSALASSASVITDRSLLAVNPTKTATFFTSPLAVADVPVEPVPGAGRLTAWAAGIGFFVLLISRTPKS
jgi:hypothetical protein